MCDLNEIWLERQQSQNEFERAVRRIQNFDVIRYMEWIERFTQKQSLFYSDDASDVDEFEDNVTKTDIINISKLERLYDVVNNYANSNYIYPKSLSHGKFYYIQYNDKIYEIGIISSNNKVISCELKKDIDITECIEIHDIISPSKHVTQRKETIEKEIKKLSDLVDELVENGIPYGAIRSEVNKAISKHQKNK